MEGKKRLMSQTCKLDLSKVVDDLRRVSPSERATEEDLDNPQELLDIIAAETKFLRSSGTKPSLIVPLLLGSLQMTPEEMPLEFHFLEAGMAVSLLAEKETAQPNYHNQHHIVEVVVAAHVLGRRERLPNRAIAELLLAATAHDLGHTGQNNNYKYEREACSFAAAHPIFEQAGLPEDVINRIQFMIMATDFQEGVPAAHAQYLKTQDLELDDPVRLLAAQTELLTEADVLFSCFDLDYNDLLSQLLSAEWNREEDNLSLKERLAFLSSVRFISDAAQQLGLDERRRYLVEQLQERVDQSPV